MRTGCAAILLGGMFSISVVSGDAIQAQSSKAVRYPRVYGATGRPYGPTQAHYQYLRRYGRPWHGHGGQTGHHSRHHVSGGPSHGHGHHRHRHGVGLRSVKSPVSFYGYVPYAAGYYGYGGITSVPGYYHSGPYYSHVPMAPLVMQGYPLWVGRNPFNNEVLRRSQLENELRRKLPLKLSPDARKPAPIPPPSSPKATLNSRRAQAQGDAHMRKQEYQKAWKRYRRALQTAPDRSEPFFRTGFALVALGMFEASGKYFKRGLQLDPNWPVNGQSLGRIFGRRNRIAKNETLRSAAQWVKQDFRDPDRLFILGVLLHFDNQTDKAAVVFKAAYRLAGRGEHLAAFLTSPLYADRATRATTSTDPNGATDPNGTTQPNGAAQKQSGKQSNPAENTTPAPNGSRQKPSADRARHRLQPPKPPLPDDNGSQNPVLPPLPTP